MSGGSIPLNNSHSVIDKPESVSLVKPPIITIEKIRPKDVSNQKKNNLLIFLLYEVINSDI